MMMMANDTAPNDSNVGSAKSATTRIDRSPDCDGEVTRKQDRLLSGDDDATVATAKPSGHVLSCERLVEWALATRSSIDPTHPPLRSLTSRSSLSSDEVDNDDDEDEDKNDASSSDASFSSSEGLENVSVASDVILPPRYSFHSYPPDDCHQRQAHSPPEDCRSIDPEKFTTEHELDITSYSSASTAPSSQSDRSLGEPGSHGDEEDETDDADSDMTIGEAATQMIECLNESDDDLESKASSSRFAPDEFWDWLDNVQVAFIEVDNHKLPRKPKTKVSTSAVPKKAAGDLIEREKDLSCSDLPASATACYEPHDECHDEVEDCLIASDHQRNDDIGRSASKHGLLLKHNASVADFRSHAEQVERSHHYVPYNLHRTVSYADMTAEQSPLPHEPNDDCTTRIRQISSNEHLLLTLHRRTKPSRSEEISPFLGIHASHVTSRAQRGEFSGALVCHEPSRTRWTRRLALVLPLIYVLALTSSKVPPQFYKVIAATFKPRTLTINLDSTLLPSYESVSVTFGTSAPAVVDVLKGKLPESLDDVNAILAKSKLSAIELYNYLKDNLPSSPEIMKPRMVKDASVAYEEAGELIGSSRATMGDHQRSQSIDRLQSTLSRAHVVLMRHLSELCRSIEGPKEAVLGPCDALYETLPNTFAAVEVQADLRPPQLTFDKDFSQSFDVMANETLEFIVRFATAIRDQVPQQEFMTNDSLSTGTLSSERSPPTVLRLATQEGDSDRLVEPVPPNDSGSPVEHASTQDVPKESNMEREPPSQNTNSKNPNDACEGNGGVALSQRVNEILSHLDAKGRLDELESLLVEKFGSDVVDPPSSISLEANNNLGWIPLLGKERDRHLHEHWLNSVEKLVVESMRQGHV